MTVTRISRETIEEPSQTLLTLGQRSYAEDQTYR